MKNPKHNTGINIRENRTNQRHASLDAINKFFKHEEGHVITLKVRGASYQMVITAEPGDRIQLATYYDGTHAHKLSIRREFLTPTEQPGTYSTSQDNFNLRRKPVSTNEYSPKVMEELSRGGNQ